MTNHLIERRSDDRVAVLEQQLVQHINDSRAYRETTELRNKKTDDLIESLINTQKHTEVSVEKLATSIEGLVKVYEAGRTVVSIGAMLGKLAKWLGSMAIFVVLYHQVTAHFEKQAEEQPAAEVKDQQ